jgi:hypothetical protein
MHSRCVLLYIYILQVREVCAQCRQAGAEKAVCVCYVCMTRQCNQRG